VCGGTGTRSGLVVVIAELSFCSADVFRAREVVPPGPAVLTVSGLRDERKPGTTPLGRLPGVCGGPEDRLPVPELAAKAEYISVGESAQAVRHTYRRARGFSTALRIHHPGPSAGARSGGSLPATDGDPGESRPLDPVRTDPWARLCADGRREAVGVTEPLVVEIEGRDTLEEALVLGDEVIIGQTVIEKLDLLVDCVNRRLVPNPAHPDQPVSKVK